MADIDDDYEITYSPLGGSFTQDGLTVEVVIYRGPDEAEWILEVVDYENASHLWDERFDTDESAMQEFLASVKKDGMKQFNPHYRRRVH